MTSVFFDDLSTLDRISVRVRPKSDVQIETGARLAASFVALPKEARIATTEQITTSERWKKLLPLSGFLAETAINTDDPKLLTYALLLHIIEGFEYDYRENFRYLVLINYAARELGVGFESLVGKVASLGTEKARTYIKQFAARDPEVNRLSSFGIRDDRSTGVFRFVPT